MRLKELQAQIISRRGSLLRQLSSQLPRLHQELSLHPNLLIIGFRFLHRSLHLIRHKDHRASVQLDHRQKDLIGQYLQTQIRRFLRSFELRSIFKTDFPVCGKALLATNLTNTEAKDHVLSISSHIVGNEFRILRRT